MKLSEPWRRDENLPPRAEVGVSGGQALESTDSIISNPTPPIKVLTRVLTFCRRL
jgi:hypothetical protein